MRRSTGLTLLELILVLAIVVIVVSLAVPRLLGVAGRQALQGAAAEIHNGLLDSRTRAMRTGQSHWLIYAPESPYYAVLADPMTEAEWARWEQVQAELQQRVSQLAMAREVRASTALGTAAVRTLPRDTRFIDSAAVSASLGAAGVVSGSFGNAPGVNASSGGTAGAASGGGMSGMGAGMPGGGTGVSPTPQLAFPAVRFGPDGSSDDGLIVIADLAGNQIPVVVRGLTGTAEVGELASSQQPYVGRGVRP